MLVVRVSLCMRHDRACRPYQPALNGVLALCWRWRHALNPLNQDNGGKVACRQTNVTRTWQGGYVAGNCVCVNHTDCSSIILNLRTSFWMHYGIRRRCSPDFACCCRWQAGIVAFNDWYICTSQAHTSALITGGLLRTQSMFR
jgi:hypothetical protein